MILPQVKSKTTKSNRRWWEFFSKSSDDPTAITVPTPLIMRSQCMEIHLQPTKDIIMSGNFLTLLQKAINGCVSLIQCAFVQWVEYRGNGHKWEVNVEQVSQPLFFVYTGVMSVVLCVECIELDRTCCFGPNHC